jgi:hypothetical protein
MHRRHATGERNKLDLNDRVQVRIVRKRLKVSDEQLASLVRTAGNSDTLGQAASSFDRQAISWHPLGATAAPTAFRDDRGGY